MVAKSASQLVANATPADTKLVVTHDPTGVAEGEKSTLAQLRTALVTTTAVTTAGGLTASSTATLTNKTFDANGTGNSLSNVETADIAASSKSGADTTLITGTAGTNGDLAIWNVDGDLVDGPTPPTGTIVGTSDTQTLTNKTIDGDNNTISNLGLGSEVDWAAADDVTTASAFEAGDKLLVFEAGVGMRKIDYSDLPGAGGGLSNIVEDPTPQLGGNLDVNGNKITSATNGNVDIEPNGTGNVLIGNFTFDADQTVGAGQDNYVLTYDNASGLISLEEAAASYVHPNHSGDVTSVGDGATTIAANAVTDAKFRQSAALSVVGRSANSTGDVADITAPLDGGVLRRSGTTVEFGSINLASANAVTGLLPLANFANGSALSVIGRSANSTGVNASIAAGTDHQVLRRSGTSLGFGAVNLAQSAAVTGSLPVANGGTGRATSTTAYGLIAAGTTATGAHQTLAAGATTEILVGGGASALPVWTAATGSGAPVRATSPTLVTPALGTPSSGTLTNCTGLPVAGITASTSTALGVGSIELGHASDTTIARVAAGRASVEGQEIATVGGAQFVSAQANNSFTVNPKFWSGTQASYDALTPTDGELYFIEA